ncbi:hypothetical protein [Pedobacter rhodius]|uniref:Uncharacterized protein n=1 Tax=Pedobacter rhodius TaxID=3004098 RepID=A0ABT4KV39_9SPHI|nr:hypothetical protein [Pedobacter sp. SJ11]MCZ4222640.1 hypothetical protein [Pedobacter sp. SJ11]
MARFNLEDLIQREKADLDKLKVAIEIYQSEDKYEFERRKFKTENLRFFAIAFLTAVISLGSSYFIESFKQRNTISQDIKKEFVELKKNYLTEKDRNKQNELACALANFENVLQDKTIEKAQLNFKKICSNISDIQQQTETIANTDTSSAAVKTALSKLSDYDSELQSLKQKTRIASVADKSKILNEIAKVNSNINAVVNSVPELEKAVKSSENIEKNVKQIETITTDIKDKQIQNEATSEKSSVLWFKEGYFLQFKEFRILLQYLDKDLGIQVQICKTKSTRACENPLLTKAWVKFGSPLQFSDGDQSYRINLEAIAHAGKNPFNLAAYVTFETLKQKD